jgi:hypothetical protein
LGIGLGSFLGYKTLALDKLNRPDIGFIFEKISSKHSSIHFEKGEVLDLVDPQVQHMGKWILAITDGVAVGDFNNDGLIDLFFTSGHKSAKNRNSLFINRSNFQFERFESKELSAFASDIKKYGIPSNAMFVDFDNDGDLDLFITYAFGEEGTSRLFKNLLMETGDVTFVNYTKESNLEKFTNAATANFLDFNNDGNLDLVIGNTIATYLPDYSKPTKLNLFHLPLKDSEDDKKPFNFMHESWHKAENAATNDFYIQSKDHLFALQDPKAIGMPETKWSMAIATSDFNQDGFIDLYIANDFGSDDFYYNQNGKLFKAHRGHFFGSIGKDTYKGMNATVADFDNNGMNDVHVSNVHHQLQAEGNLLFYFYPTEKKNDPKIIDQATYSGALNENRFGWGAAASDFNNDGWTDMAQANGMVDDLFDKKYKSCPDFWYINEKIARSSPDIHKYINNWGDIRGTCIHGFEKNRLYLNRGMDKKPQFIDVADYIGMNESANFRGLANADFDNDGRVDLVVSSLYRDPIIYKNIAVKSSMESKQNWIGLKLTSLNTKCNRMALGSKIWLKSGSNNQYQESQLVNGFSAQHDQRLHFGLGKNVKIENLKISWCGNQNLTINYTNLKINQYNEIILH